MKLLPRFSLRTLVVFLLLVTAGMGLLCVWPAWRVVQSFEGHTNLVTSVSFSPDRAQVLSAGRDGAVRVWDASTGAQLHRLAPLYCHRAPFWARYLAGGEEVAILTNDGVLAVWRVGADRPEVVSSSRLDEFHPLGLEVVGGAESLVGLDASGTRIAVVDPRSGRRLRSFPLPRVLRAAYALVPGSGDFVAATADGSVVRLDLATGESDELCPAGGPLASAVAVSQDGRRLALAVDDGVRIYDLDSRRQIAALPGCLKESPYRIAFCPDGSRIITFDGYRTATILRHRGGDLLWQARAPLAHYGGEPIQFSPEGRSVLLPIVQGAQVWRRGRPEPWWGVFWLWEFWLTAAFAGLFVWSVVRDRRRFAAAPGVEA